MRDIIEQIRKLTRHNIPFYAYGNNEAACEMDNRLNEIEILISELERQLDEIELEIKNNINVNKINF